MKKEKKQEVPDTKTLLSAIEKLQTEKEESQKAQMRALADLQNFQRRESENKIHWSRDAVSRFLTHLLPRFSELEMSAEHTEDADVKKTIQNLFQTLEKQGFEKINPKKNTPLNPELHEVLLTEEGKKGCVVQVLEPGWKFQNKIITPAKVSAAQE